ncbi:MAG TPA: hypothetical protein ENN88_00260 [Candidatus Coatesbacteria bacterium]|nr:hypothetical protein [Candidatus Coatesbacteria bacterium]
MKMRKAAALLFAAFFIATGCATRSGTTRLAYTASVGGAQEVYLYNAETGEERQLTFTRGQKESPAFSADGKWVFFSGDADGEWEIYRVPAEGGEVERLTQNLTPDRFPACGILDASVAFLAFDYLGPALAHLDEPGNPDTLMRLGPVFPHTPDGLVLDRTGGLAAYVHSGDIGLLSLRSNLFRPVVASPAHNTDPAFTADSRALVFSSDAGGSYDLYLAALDGGETVRLTRETGDARYPATDQDNRTIYFYLAPEGIYRRVETPPSLELLFRPAGELTGLALWP